jgi:hypothetical protein
VNLEITGVQVKLAPESFIETMEELLWVGRKAAIDKILWGMGAPHFHPQPMIGAFWEFDFPEMEHSTGTFKLTKNDKEKILGKNIVEAHNVDVEMRLTSPACFMIPLFIEEVDEKVGSVPGIESVDLETDNGFE